MQTLLVRLTEEDRVLLDRLSAESAGSRAAVVRQALRLLAGRNVSVDPERNRLLRDLARAYAQAGVNLNQLARRLYIAGTTDMVGLATVLSEIIALNDATRRALVAASAGQGRPSASAARRNAPAGALG